METNKLYNIAENNGITIDFISLCENPALSLEYGGKYGVLVTVLGIFTGALCLNLVDKLVSEGMGKSDAKSLVKKLQKNFSATTLMLQSN